MYIRILDTYNQVISGIFIRVRILSINYTIPYDICKADYLFHESQLEIQFCKYL